LSIKDFENPTVICHPLSRGLRQWTAT